jgi:hypothetical protein
MASEACDHCSPLTSNHWTHKIPIIRFTIWYILTFLVRIIINSSCCALKSDSTHHFFRNACTKSGSLRFSQFSGCWLILSVYTLMSFDFPFVRLYKRIKKIILTRYHSDTFPWINPVNVYVQKSISDGMIVTDVILIISNA